MSYHKALSQKFFFSALCLLLSAFSWGAPPPSEINLGEAGMDIFSTAYQWEADNASGYNQQALQGFTKKLNKAIGQHPTLSNWHTQCVCQDPVGEGFDAALLQYLRETLGGAQMSTNFYAGLVAPHLNKKINNITSREAALLDELIRQIIDDISIQVREQMDAFRDISGMGLYADGDESNSTFDIKSDLKRIDKLFFEEISTEDSQYKNMGANESSGLITGQFLSGEWVGGEQYDLKLLGDIDKALGVSDTSKKGSQGDEAVGECESGFCVTVDSVKSTHYFLSTDSARGGSSFEGIYRAGLDWITKNGSKRNLACKAPPTINFFESTNDSNFSFKDIFSGLGIYVFWKVPQSLSEIGGTGTRVAFAASLTEDEKKHKNETQEMVHRAFVRQGMDPTRSLDMMSSRLQLYQQSSLNNSQPKNTSQSIATSVNNAESEYRRSLQSYSTISHRFFVQERENNTLQQFEKKFDEQSTVVKALYDHVQGFNTLLKSIQSKPDCGN